MTSNKELKGETKEDKEFYDRKVQQQGYSQTLALTHVLPNDWKYVRITPLEETDERVIVQLDCLLRQGEHA